MPPRTVACPGCGGLKTDGAKLCTGCRAAEWAGRVRRGASGARPARLVGSPSQQYAHPSSDTCDVCDQRLPVAELAYRTVQPRRSGGTETLIVGHRACLERQAGPVG